MRIGDNIRFIRDKERNYTQAYVAAQLGMSIRAYSNIENNLSDVLFSRLQQIAKVLGYDISYIVTLEPPGGVQPDDNAPVPQGNISLDTLYTMYEDIKKLHAEIIAVTSHIVKTAAAQ